MDNQADRSDRLLAEARAVDPGSDLVLQRIQAPQQPMTHVEPAQSKDMLFAPPLQIAAAAGVHDLHLRGDVKQVLSQVASTYGIKAVYDADLVSQQIRFDLDAVTYTQAMPILLRMAHLFAVPIDSKTLFVVKDSQEARQKYERQAEETIFVPGSTQEQLNELVNIIKNVFDVKQIAIQQNSSSLVVRAPEPTLKAVNYTIADLVDGNAQVVMELKLYTVDKTRTRNLGLTTPNSVGGFSVAAEAQGIVSANQSVIQQAISQGLFTPSGNAATDTITEAIYLIASGLATDAKLSGLLTLVGGGLTTAGIYVGSNPTLNFALDTSDTRALDDITVRSGDRQTTTLKVGSKYPITTSTYSSGVSAATSSALAGVTVGGVSASSLLNQYLGASSQTIPQIQYEDIGITLKTTPTVLKSGLITMHIDLKIEALTGQSANNIPVLTSRVFTSDVTCPEGSTAMMLSQLSSQESAAVSGIPGLAELPGFQTSVADRITERDSSELVMMVTPHLVRRRSNTLAGPRIAFQTSVPQEN